LACHSRQGFKKPSPSLPVQLACHIVEKKHRRFPILPFDVRPLRDLEREHQRANLTLRAMLPSPMSAKVHFQVVRLRSKPRETATHVFAALDRQTFS